MAKRVETRNAWLLWSMVVGFNHLLLGFADKGDVTLAVLLALVVGMPYGARHLNDTIVADIMDYDEVALLHCRGSAHAAHHTHHATFFMLNMGSASFL